ncbi:GreA/GreB family elongation factor [Pontibacter sp. E15-1]|uniref:GreA/GreB family elongation factor n=1 Tax=Pontibacter sp. E15-1 TaxID=2919918 RepID=UPI001F4F98F9|nr:GreA/GreB family elongation factor [Pontibacter sp. E15-1]MCJ8165031.1 GreA/GreB family elongation factor [Pontibacter sp. E15-1]
MSRAFVKEDDAGEPPIIPSRPALPPGASNYVTPNGLAQLREELTALELQRAKAEASHDDEANRTRQLTILNAQLAALTQRISSAKVIEPSAQPPDVVRFGATVTLLTRTPGQASTERRFTIVGVDEASVADGKVAFVAPIARAVSGARVGQKVSLRMAGREETLEVIAIAYT